MKGLGAILRNHISGGSFIPYFYLQENYGSHDERPWDIPIELVGIDAMHQRGVFELPGGEVHVDSTSQASVTRISLRLQVDSYVPFVVNRGFGQNTASDETFLAISGFPRMLYPNHGTLSPSPGVSPTSKEPSAELAAPAQSPPAAHTEPSSTGLLRKFPSMRISRPAKLEQSHKLSRWSDPSSVQRDSQTNLDSMAELPGHDASSSRPVGGKEDSPGADKIGNDGRLDTDQG